MSDKQPIGRKHDQGKTLSGTVLAGFWRVAGRDALTYTLSQHPQSAFDTYTVERLIDVFDEFFDVDMPIRQRLDGALEELREELPPELYLRGAIEVGSYGARKYERDNWLHVEDGINRYYEAVGRHVEDLICGHWYDDDKEGPDGEVVEGSHLPNLSHIFWGILAAGELLSRKRDAETFASGELQVDGKVVGQLFDFETNVVEPNATEPPKPQTSVAFGCASNLVLPLEVGKKYRVIYDGQDEGVHQCMPFADAHCSDGGGADCAVGGWLCRTRNGAVVFVEDVVRLEGPVSE